MSEYADDTSFMRHGLIYTDAARAANAFQQGYVVDWQPGEGTRYECVKVTKGDDVYLALLNIGGWTVKVSYPRSCKQWIQAGLPRGSWYGLRPFLAACGFATGPLTLRAGDQQEEFRERADTDMRRDTPQAFTERNTDATIGRVVRNLLEAEGYAIKETP